MSSSSKAVAKPQAIVPEIILPRVTGADIELHGLPKWLHAAGVEHLREALHWNAVAQAQARGFAVATVLCGTQLLALKAEAGHGRWADLLARHILTRGLSERTVQRYMQIGKAAERLLGKRLQGGGHHLDPSRLLADPTRLDAEDRETLQGAISDVTDATTWRELLEDFGVAGRGRKGGYRPAGGMLAKFAAERGLDANDFDNWPAAERTEFRTWLRDERERQAREAAERDPEGQSRRRRDAAVREWSPVIRHLHVAVGGKSSWGHLPPGMRAEMVTTLRKLADLVEASMK